MAKNLQQASKRAIYESRVSQLDGLGSDMTDWDELNLSKVEDIAGQFIVRVLENIQNEDLPVTGSIENIQLQVENNRVNVLAPSHILYMDRGVNGSKEKRYDTIHSYTDKMPPAEVFTEWIRTKNIQLRSNSTYYGAESPFKDLTNDEQIAQAGWAIVMSVFQKGLKPRNIYTKEIPKLIEDLQEQIPGFLMQQVVQAINVKPSAVRIIL